MSDLRQSSPPLRGGNARSQSVPMAIAHRSATAFSATEWRTTFELPKTISQLSETTKQSFHYAIEYRLLRHSMLLVSHFIPRNDRFQLIALN